MLEPRWEGRPARLTGKENGGKDISQYSTPERSRLLSQERGAAPKLQRRDKAKVLPVFRTLTLPTLKAFPHASPTSQEPRTREEVEKTAWGRGGWAELVLCGRDNLGGGHGRHALERALSLETWSWVGEEPCEALGQARDRMRLTCLREPRPRTCLLSVHPIPLITIHSKRYFHFIP